MRFTLDRNESLDIAIVDGNQIVGTVSLAIRGITLSGAPTTKSAGGQAGATSATGKTRKRRRKLSADARAKMAEAQRKRWDKFRQGKK